MPAVPLAALVRHRQVDAAIASYRDAGVYDDTRRVSRHDDGTVAIPVTKVPQIGPHEAVIVTAEADRRRSGLDSRLRDRGLSPAAIARAPKAWAVIGTVILVEFPPAYRHREVVGEALLEIHGNADTVLAREGVEGPHREPTVTVVAGEGRTETVHREHGIEYALDLAQVMFSPGNQAERTRMGRLVAPGERVFDMFAGIGYFTLPMAVAGARVTAAEINPDAFGYLLENRERNDVRDRVSAYRADCRDVQTTADRIVMGHYDAPDFLEVALQAIRPGGRLHCHAAVRLDRRDTPRRRLSRVAAEAGRSVTDTTLRRVKTTGERWEHVVLDATIR